MSERTNYSVARVKCHNDSGVGMCERHNERKNESYSNKNIILERTPYNVHYKKCDTTYNERLKEMVDNNIVSLRGLKNNAKMFNELIFDINSEYFEKHGGYEFAKEFYEKAYQFAEEEMGADYIISAVMHADELNVAFTEEYGEPIYHYHLHVVALPVVQKEIKWSKRCKDKSLVGTVKEVINQVSHSKKWRSEQAYDEMGKPVYLENGKPSLVKSYSVLQDKFYNYMSNAGFKDFIRGERGSATEHLDNLSFKIQQDKKRLENINATIGEKEQEFEKLATMKIDVDNMRELGKKKKFSKNVEMTEGDYNTLVQFAQKGISADKTIKKLSVENRNLRWTIHDLKEQVKTLLTELEPFRKAMKIAPQKVMNFFKEIFANDEQEQKQKAKQNMETPSWKANKTKRRDRDAR